MYGGGEANQIQQTADGGFVVSGTSRANGSNCIVVLKTSSFGDKLWSRTYTLNGWWNHTTSIQQTTDGGYVIAGTTKSVSTEFGDFFVVKTNGGGDTLWTRVYGRSHHDIAYCVQQTVDGGYIVAGHTYTLGATMDFYVVRISELGDTLWTRTYGGSGTDAAKTLQQTADGGYVIAGTKGHWTLVGRGFAGPSYFYVVKTDNTGDTLWTRIYEGGAEASSVQQTADGGYVVAGTTKTIGSGTDFYVVKTDTRGDTMWTRTYGGTGADNAHCIRQTIDGGYVIAGSTVQEGSLGSDFYIVKTWTAPRGLERVSNKC